MRITYFVPQFDTIATIQNQFISDSSFRQCCCRSYVTLYQHFEAGTLDVTLYQHFEAGTLGTRAYQETSTEENSVVNSHLELSSKVFFMC